MKKAILLAAALTASSLLAPLASKAAPQFTVTAASPGAINFSGSGTAQFNNSIGTNNSFQVGSSTNLGVNASTSSTPEYGVSTVANLDLAGTSVLQQVIGTSGTFKQNENQSTSAYTAASSFAVDVLSQAGWGASYATASESKKAEYSSEASYEAGYKAAYSAAVVSGYAATSTNSSTNTQSQGNDGVISGNFRTVEVGSARAGGSSTDWSAAATSSADVTHGSSYENRTNQAQTEVEYKSAYDASYNQSYAQSSAASNRYTDSSVTVRGIGSDASVAAAATSKFNVSIDAVEATGTTGTVSTSTANGSAGASLSTSSFANQSQASTASAFMQAFGGGETTP